MRIDRKVYCYFPFSRWTYHALLVASMAWPAFSSPITDSLQFALNTAQDTARIHILNQLASYYQFSDATQAKHYLDSALSEARQMGFIPGEAEALLNLGVYYLLQGDHELCKTNTTRALHFFKILKHQKGMAECYKNLGVMYFYADKYPEAKSYYHQALSLFQALNDVTGQAKCYANLGLIYDHYGNYQEALSYFLNSLKMNEALNNQEGIASSYGYIAYVYHNLNDFTNALSYQHKALKIFKASDNKARLGGLLSDMGNNYLELEEYTRALDYYHQALTLAKASEDMREMAYVFNNMGAVYDRMHNYPLALEYYTKSLQLKEKSGEKRTLPNTLKNIAQLHVYLSQPDEAIHFAQQGLALAREINAKKDLQNIHLTLSEAYTAKEEHAQALVHYQQYSTYRDSIFDEEKTRQIAEMQARYDVEKKEQEIAAQQQEITLLEINKITERNFRLALMTGSVLLMLLSLFIYTRYRTKQKTAQVLDQKNREIASKNEEIKRMNKELEKRMLRAQMDPHFIFNALNAIQHLIIVNDKTSALKYLSKFSKLVRQTLENSVSHKVPVADEIRLLKYYLELEALRFDNQFDYVVEIDEGLDIYNVEIPFLLLQPYVENAIVHGLRYKNEQGRIKIHLQNQHNYLHCVVEDNGIGREEAAKISANHGKHHISRGMSVTNQRLATLNTDQKCQPQLKITDLYDYQMKAAGTKVEIFIPLELN